MSFTDEQIFKAMAAQSPNTLFETFLDFLNEFSHVTNSMQTTKNYDIKNGERIGMVQLKWWKEKSTLIIKKVFLSPSIKIGDERYVVDAECKKLMDYFPFIHPCSISKIVIESPAPFFVQKYSKRGWIHNQDRGELFISRAK